ncbi:MAG: M14/M99 family metallopeptidase [Desulfovibrionaceae bacterium]|nr:M14/M99 family metallopeptidase [Desulfovibrionaceae bacterium]
MKKMLKICLALTMGLGLLWPDIPAVASGERQRLVFLQDTDQEFEVYKIRGRENGPTVMILGGIHGDEPGAFLSADLHTNLSVKRGNLIVAPRVNSRSIIHNQRGYGGDMNRKFAPDQGADPEYRVIAILKSLMAESDALITLHDGSGFYSPEWKDNLSNPRRYGQSIITDAAVYDYEGREIRLQENAEKALRKVNLEIGNPRYKFTYFNMDTGNENSPHREHRLSATYFALTRLGIPAFCIEISKNLPSLEMKIYQHHLALNALLESLGVIPEERVLDLPSPRFSHLVILVNEKLPLALTAGQTLAVAPGETLRLLHVAANFAHGLSVDVEDVGGLNDLNRPLILNRDSDILVRKDHEILGRVHIAMLPEADSPKVLGKAAPWTEDVPIPYSLEQLAGTQILAELEARESALPERAPAEITPETPALPPVKAETDPPVVTGFLVELNGLPLVVKPGEELVVPPGARVLLVDIQSSAPLPPRTVMNLRGYIAPRNARFNTGEDRGGLVDTAKDLLPAFSENKDGEIYRLNAELGKKILGSCSIRLSQPTLASVTVRIAGETRILPLGSRTAIAPGTPVELLEVAVSGGQTLARPRFTLAGRPLPADLPQTLIMRDIAINLAIFDDELLTGKVTWVPQTP